MSVVLMAFKRDLLYGPTSSTLIGHIQDTSLFIGTHMRHTKDTLGHIRDTVHTWDTLETHLGHIWDTPGTLERHTWNTCDTYETL